MNEQDYFITDTYTNSSPNVITRITHKPSGISVCGEGVRTYKLRLQLMAELEEKLKKDSMTNSREIVKRATKYYDKLLKERQRLTRSKHGQNTVIKSNET